MAANNSATDIRLIPISQLKVDHSFQRDLVERRVNELSDHWSPDLLGVLKVSQRKDGDLVVLDGQHRLAALRHLVSDGADVNTSAWCEVYFDLTSEQEAARFLGLNDQLPVQALSKFKARVKAGEPSAVAVQQTVQRFGGTINFKRSIGYACVSLLFDKVLPWGALEETLAILEGSWSDDLALRDVEAKHSRQFVEGVAVFARNYLDHPRYFRSHAVRKFATRVSPSRLVVLARTEAAAVKTSQAVVIAQKLRAAYNYERKTDTRLPEIVAPKGYRG